MLVVHIFLLYDLFAIYIVYVCLLVCWDSWWYFLYDDVWWLFGLEGVWLIFLLPQTYCRFVANSSMLLDVLFPKTTFLFWYVFLLLLLFAVFDYMYVVGETHRHPRHVSVYDDPIARSDDQSFQFCITPPHCYHRVCEDRCCKCIDGLSSALSTFFSLSLYFCFSCRFIFTCSNPILWLSTLNYTICLTFTHLLLMTYLYLY